MFNSDPFFRARPIQRLSILLTLAFLLLAGCDKPVVEDSQVLDSGQPLTEWAEPHMRYKTRTNRLNEAVFARPLRNEPVPVVLIFHHLPGQPGVPAPRAYETLTARLIDKGIAVVRIFLDSSTEEFFDIHYNGIEDLLGDARASMSELEQREFADLTRVGALGYGTGGSLALTAAASGEFPISTLVLWSPDQSYPEAFTRLLGSDAGANLAEGQVYNAHFQGRAVKLSSAFFEDIKTYPSPVTAAAELQIPALGITGENATQALSSLRELAKAYDGPEFRTVTVNGTDATLSITEVHSPATEEALQLTVDWFVTQLKPTSAAEYNVTHREENNGTDIDEG